MSLTVIETCPPLLYDLTFRSSSEQNCQVINQKISCKGTSQSKDVKDYKAFKPCPLSQERKRIEINKSVASDRLISDKGTALITSTKRTSITSLPRRERVNMALEGRCLEVLESLREPLADYQEKHGLAKTEQYGFIALMTALINHAYNAIITIVTMLYNLLPLLEGFLYLARFILDKLIDICQSRETTDKALKAVIFIGEMVAIVIVLMIICGFILFPVWCLFSILFSKIWSLIISNATS